MCCWVAARGVAVDDKQNVRFLCCLHIDALAHARDAALEGVLRGRGVLLSTYGMVLHNADGLAGAAPEGGSCSSGSVPLWDVLILDEVRP